MSEKLTEVILVDEHDQPIGTMEKLEAHKKAMLHRAFSIFIFNGKKEMLLQRRALDKYHSGGLWTNSCCSHPLPGEDLDAAAHRRLIEELGFDAPMEKIFHFIYKEEFENGLTEYEFDHVFAGFYDGEVNFDKKEVMEAEFKSVTEIDFLMRKSPQVFTAWFRLAFPRMQAWWNQDEVRQV